MQETVKNDSTAAFFAGTSGLVLPVPNKKFYPPAFREKSRLGYYAHLFNSIEVNSSFYKMPRGVTVARWAETVGPDFRFTYKLLRDITHAKRLDYPPALLTSFLDAIAKAGDKKGSLLIQFPGSLQFESIGQLEKLLFEVTDHPESKPWDIALEFRNTSWYRQETYALIRHHGMEMVLHDMPRSTPPFTANHAQFVYLRFHGPAGDYRGGYDDQTLARYATQIKEWVNAGLRVYTYFNNTMGDAVLNLQQLNALAGDR